MFKIQRTSPHERRIHFYKNQSLTRHSARFFFRTESQIKRSKYCKLIDKNY